MYILLDNPLNIINQNKILENKNDQINYLNIGFLNQKIDYLSENGEVRKLPFINGNNLVKMESKLFNCTKNYNNSYSNNNPKSISNYNNNINNLNTNPYNQYNITNKNHYDLNKLKDENELENTIGRISRLGIAKNSDINNYYNKRNEFATVYDNQNIKNHYFQSFEKNIKTLKEKSNIF